MDVAATANKSNSQQIANKINGKKTYKNRKQETRTCYNCDTRGHLSSVEHLRRIRKILHFTQVLFEMYGHIDLKQSTQYWYQRMVFGFGSDKGYDK